MRKLNYQPLIDKHKYYIYHISVTNGTIGLLDKMPIPNF